MSCRIPSLFLASLAVAGVCMVVAWAQDATPKAVAPDKAVVEKSTEGQKQLWGALIFASNDRDAPKREDFKKPSADLQKRLSKVFAKYSTFELLGERTEALFKDTYSWVAPSKEVCVKFDSKGLTDDGGIKLDLQLWSQDKAVIKTDAILKADSPVFIEGPRWGQGRLLFVVQLQEKQGK